MQEIFRTNEPAETAFVKSLLESAKIKYFIFDEHLTAALGGTMDNISECRFMVLGDDYDDAMHLLTDAGLFDPEEEFFEVFATEDKSLADRAKSALDRAEIMYELDEYQDGDDGMIPGVGHGPITYVFAARDSWVDEACDVLADEGLIKPVEGNA
jgi:hypothetical protein